MAMARPCSASSSAWRRPISALCSSRSLDDALLLDGELGLQPRLLDRQLRRDGGGLAFLLLLGALARQLGALPHPRDLDLALLADARVLGFAVDLELQLLRLEVLVADGDQGVLLDVVSLLLALLDALGEARHALGVEGVAGVEELEAGLVELSERRGFELEAVHRQVAGDAGAHALHILAALLVHLFHRHGRRHGAQRVDELALEQLLQPIGLERAHAERLRRVGHGLVARLHAHVELGRHVDAQPVARDQRLVAAAHDLEAKRVHVDGDDVVDDRQHEGAAAEHHLLPAQARANEGALLR